jgi:hypothetical protein
MDTSEIISAIESKIRDTKYFQWTVGITEDPQRRREEHENDKKDTKLWSDWKASSEKDARDAEQHFLDKGMNGSGGGGDSPIYVYIF